MDLYLSASGGFPDPLDSARRVTPEDARRVGVIAGMPFVCRGAEYDPVINRWLRQLPSLGAHSANTWRGYAHDVVTFARFLSSRATPRELLAATDQDTQDYFLIRRRGPMEFRLASSSWNRALAALESFYGWALSERLIERKPFKYRARKAWREGDLATAQADVASNLLGVRRTRRPVIVHLSMDSYRFLRDVGLRGFLPDGRPNPGVAMRTGYRNAVLADLLVMTGARITEGTSLLVQELPTRAELDRIPEGENYALDLSPACCKGGKGRRVYLPKRTAQDLLGYVEVDRADDVARALAAGRYRAADDPIYVTDLPSLGAFRMADGTLRAYSMFDPVERARLVVVRDGVPQGPAWLFVGDDGTPKAADWDAVLRDAAARCHEQGRAVRVTPHVLRHTFAVHTLSNLIYKSAEAALARRPGSPGGEVYQALMGDALQELKELMGHVSVTTTFIYLRCLREARTIVNAAAIRLAKQVYGDTYTLTEEDDTP